MLAKVAFKRVDWAEAGYVVADILPPPRARRWRPLDFLQVQINEPICRHNDTPDRINAALDRSIAAPDTLSRDTVHAHDLPTLHGPAWDRAHASITHATRPHAAAQPPIAKSHTRVMASGLTSTPFLATCRATMPSAAPLCCEFAPALR